MDLSNYHDVSVAHGICKTFWAQVHIFLYLVDGLLIDTGPAVLGKESRAFFDQHPIDKVALTHLHEDHSGMASWLQKNRQATIYLHPEACPQALQKGKYPLYRHYHWGGRKPFTATPMPDMIHTEKHSFRSIDTPGHTPYHHAFYENNQGWLFTGDLFLGTKLLVVFFEENMQDTIVSLEKLLQLDFDTIFCAHAGIIKDGKKKMYRKLDFLTSLRDEVNLYRQQGLSNREIDAKINPKNRIIKIISQGEWSSYNIINTI